MSRQIGVGFLRTGAHEPGIAGAYAGYPGSRARSRPSGGTGGVLHDLHGG